MNKHNIANLAVSILFGCLIGFFIASIDRAYNLSSNISPETPLSLVPPKSFTVNELDLTLLYWIEIVGSGFFGLLAGLAAAQWRDKKLIVLVSLVMFFGIAKGAINFAIAYEYQIARLDVPRITDVSREWNTVMTVTGLHFAAGCLMCCLSFLFWKYRLT